MLFEVERAARPFLKWAGGKGQLIEQISAYFPPELLTGKINRYAEPFVGSGALFFHVVQRYRVEAYFLSDVNDELIIAYKTIKRDVEGVIRKLQHMQEEYYRLSPSGREDKFYSVRHQFNVKRGKTHFDRFSPDWVRRTAEIIFLNRTCFNGLFRVNAKSEFNVPFGRYRKPLICSPDNLRAVSAALQKAEIRCGDFTECDAFVDDSTFVYFDPPYRPISKTASFTSYSNHDFGEIEQRRLAEFYKHLHRDKGAKLMLSNSDPKNENPLDDFFDELYRDFNIKRVKANRMINCDATKRGKIDELLVMNYGPRP